MADSIRDPPTPFGGHPGWVWGVAVTPDGEEIITTGEDRTARVWNRRSGEQRTILTGHTSSVRGVAVTPDGEEIITTGEDGTTRVWNRRRVVQVRGTQLGGVGPRRQLAAVRSDEPSVKDLLDFAADVEMLAALVASSTTQPPLSIALLGEWGSGKSSFMAQMQTEVARLADLSRNNLGQSTFAANVRQVRFNAWHYSDDNVWSGLVEHLFRTLAQGESDGDPDPATVQPRRDELASELTKRLEERNRLNGDLQALAATPQPRGLLASLGSPVSLAVLLRRLTGQLARDIRHSWRVLLLWLLLAAAVLGVLAAFRQRLASVVAGASAVLASLAW